MSHIIGAELMYSCTIWNPQEASGSKMADLEDKGWVSSITRYASTSWHKLMSRNDTSVLSLDTCPSSRPSSQRRGSSASRF